MSLFLRVYLDMALAYPTRGFDPIRCDLFSRILTCSIPLALKGIKQFEY